MQIILFWSSWTLASFTFFSVSSPVIEWWYTYSTLPFDGSRHDRITLVEMLSGCIHGLSLDMYIQNWLNWFHFHFSRGRSTRYSDRLHDFSATIPRCCKDVYVISFFPRTARLWNSLPIELFPLAYDLSGFKSRLNRHLLTVGSF